MWWRAEELDDATVVSEDEDELPESSFDTANNAMTMTAARPPHFTVRFFTVSRRSCRARASRAAARFCFCRLRLSVPTKREGYLRGSCRKSQWDGHFGGVSLKCLWD